MGCLRFRGVLIHTEQFRSEHMASAWQASTFAYRMPLLSCSTVRACKKRSPRIKHKNRSLLFQKLFSRSRHAHTEAPWAATALPCALPSRHQIWFDSPQVHVPCRFRAQAGLRTKAQTFIEQCCGATQAQAPKLQLPRGHTCEHCSHVAH